VSIVRAGHERIADLEPLWTALQGHHIAISPRLGGLTPRTPQESWQLRSRHYEEVLSHPGAFLLIAEGNGDAVGYALVDLVGGSHGYRSGTLVGEVETLSVAPDSRRAGVGTALMDAVERELAQVGVREIRLAVLPANAEAIRFYKRRGMEPILHVLYGKIGQ
jgi:ribosomal protein S18 acetylase RimI-like enzyme